MVLDILKKGLLKGRSIFYKHIAGGVDMDEVAMLSGAEPRKILQTLICRKVPAIMSYSSNEKWHVAKVVLTDLGACRVTAEVIPAQRPHPLNVRANQPVGVSVKYGYGKFIFEAKVVALEPSADSASGGTIILEMPDRIQIVQRRNYFRVLVPGSLKVHVLLWPRGQRNSEAEIEACATGESKAPEGPGRYWQGRLVDISAGGAQVVVDAVQGQELRAGQFVGLRFTPMPYEMPLVFDAQIRNALPTVDDKNVCLGLQIVGLEASAEGREVLQRLCRVVEQYYKMNQSGVRQNDFKADRSMMRRSAPAEDDTDN
ncbi:MAG: flagellar brake protein [Planctomycetota bacterium]|jgi:hypothetical protein